MRTYHNYEIEINELNREIAFIKEIKNPLMLRSGNREKGFNNIINSFLNKYTQPFKEVII